MAVAVVIALSVVLFAIWFRYLCVQLLRTRSCRDYASRIAAEHRLRFSEVAGELRRMPRLAAHGESLDEDYDQLSAILDDSAAGGISVEEIVLRADFVLMRCLFRLLHPVSDVAARRALLEMTEVVAQLADRCGERLLLRV